MIFWDRKAMIKVSRDVPLLPISFSSPMRVQFKVHKNNLLQPNSCEIIISNLSRESRNHLEKFNADIELSAGYAADLPTLPIVFRGQARTIDHRKHASEWQTIIQCGDGERAYRYGQIAKSWQPGTSLIDVAKDLASSLTSNGVDSTDFLKQLSNGAVVPGKNQFVTGFTCVGNPLQELDRLLAPDGYAVSIQNGELRVVNVNGSGPRTAVLISEKTGMIGSPIHGSPDHNGLPSMLKVQSLLLPRMNPGDGFILRSEGIHGFYTSQKIIHIGDTHGSGREWRTEIDTRPITPNQDVRDFSE